MILIFFFGFKLRFSQTISVFTDTSNPVVPGVVGYHQWAFDTLTIHNTGCDANIRPEFIISHQDSISQGDFILKWRHPVISNYWPTIPYNIDGNGNAYGYWHTTSNSTNDSTGVNISVGSLQQIVIKVKFMNIY